MFNTPGANANAVKELVVCGLLLAERYLRGANHVKNVINVEENGEHEKIATRTRRIRQTLAGKRFKGRSGLSD